MHSSRPSTRPSILERPPNFILHLSFLGTLYYYKLELRAIARVGVNLEASKKIEVGVSRGSNLRAAAGVALIL